MKNVTWVCNLLLALACLAYSGSLFSAEVNCEALVEESHLAACEAHLVRKASMQAYAEAYAIYTDATVPKKIRAQIKSSARIDLTVAVSECYGNLRCQYTQLLHLRDYYRVLHSSSQKRQ